MRYRRSPNDNKTYTAVELIVDERGYAGNLKQWVAVPIDFCELELRPQAKQLGARWSKKRKVRVLQYKDAIELGIIHRQRPDLLCLIDEVETYGQV